MAEELRKVVIEVITTGDGDGITPPTPTENNGAVKRTEKKSLENILLNQAYSQAKNLVNQAVNSTLSRYYNMKEDYMFENNVNQVKTILSKTTSFATTVAGGFMVGNIPGAIIAGVGWIGSEGLSAINKMSDVYARINSSNYDKAFSRTRVGLTDNGKGTEN